MAPVEQLQCIRTNVVTVVKMTGRVHSGGSELSAGAKKGKGKGIVMLPLAIEAGDRSISKTATGKGDRQRASRAKGILETMETEVL